jgi:hypothetical protein
VSRSELDALAARIVADAAPALIALVDRRDLQLRSYIHEVVAPLQSENAALRRKLAAIEAVVSGARGRKAA